MKKLKPSLIVLEPTGGFEMLVVELTHAGLPAGFLQDGVQEKYKQGQVGR